MQIWDFLHRNWIPTRQEFLRHRLQIQSFDKVKTFEMLHKKKQY